MYAGTAGYDTQENKINRIEKLNEKRHDYEVDTIYTQALFILAEKNAIGCSSLSWFR